MTTLEELYALRKKFIEYGAEITDKLAEEIAEAESPIFNEINTYILDKAPLKLPDIGIKGRVIVAIEYKDGLLSSIYSSIIDDDDIHLSSMSKLEYMDIEDVKEEIEDEIETSFDYEDDETGTKRVIPYKSPSIPFRVIFADGTVIEEKTAIDTMIGALKHMGLEKVSHYKGRLFSKEKFPLVGKKKRMTILRGSKEPHEWQKKVDDWYIYSNLSNETKIEVLKDIGKLIDRPLIIEPILKPSVSAIPVSEAPKTKRKPSKYSFRGSKPLSKRAVVFEVIKKFIESYPDSTITDIRAFFPNELQGSYGVITSEEDYNNRKEKGQDVERRYFADSPLTNNRGEKIYVCGEWGNNFSNFRKHVKDKFGWEIEEVTDQ